MAGWVKLHRTMINWEWYDDLNCFRLFTHLILVANHADGKWRGKPIYRGQRLTSIGKLATETGLSVSQVRTAILKLESTGEIASESQAQHTVITVKNYDSYQSDDKALASEIANESQTNDKALATNKNDKNEKKEKNVNIDIDYTPFHQVGFDEIQIKEILRIRRTNKAGVITQRIVNALAKEFNKSIVTGMTLEGILNEWALRGWKSFKSDWTDAAKKTSQPSWGNKNALVQGGRYSQKTAAAIDILDNWEPPED